MSKSYNLEKIREIIQRYNEKAVMNTKMRGAAIDELLEKGFVIDAEGKIKRRSASLQRLEILVGDLIKAKRFTLKRTKIKKMCTWIDGFEMDIYEELERIDNEKLEERREKVTAEAELKSNSVLDRYISMLEKTRKGE